MIGRDAIDDQLAREAHRGGGLGRRDRERAVVAHHLAAEAEQPGRVAVEVDVGVRERVAVARAHHRCERDQLVGRLRRLGDEVGAVVERERLDRERQAVERALVRHRLERLVGEALGARVVDPELDRLDHAVVGPVRDPILRIDEEVGTVAAGDRGRDLVGERAVRHGHELEQRVGMRGVPPRGRRLEDLALDAGVRVPQDEPTAAAIARADNECRCEQQQPFHNRSSVVPSKRWIDFGSSHTRT